MKTKFTGSPLVVIGLDGCDWELIDRWSDAGEIPVLANIKQKGIHASMVSTIPPITAPALASFMTGLNPDNTGLTGFTTKDGGLISYNDIKAPAIWDFLGAAGIRSCVVGLRLTYPPKNIHGLMLSSGLLQPGENNYVKPEKYLDKCRGFQPDFNTYPTLCGAVKKGIVEDYTKLTDELIRLTEKQFRIFNDLRDTEEFPFSLFYLENSDLLQHFAWHMPDEICRLYKCIDRLLGVFLEKNPDVNVLLMSDHGFHSTSETTFCINAWLLQQGYLKSCKRRSAFMVRKALQWGKTIAFAALSRYQRRQLRLLFGKLKRPSFPATQDGLQGLNFPSEYEAARKMNFDLELTEAYASEPWGVRVISDTVKEKLVQEMKSLKDECGKPVFTHVFKKEELYTGKYFNAMPDILFLVQSRFAVDTFSFKKIYKPFKNPKNITGSHDQAYYGVIMAYGKGVNTNVHIDTFRIIDFLPTILDYFGISCPAAVDGVSKALIMSSGSNDKEKLTIMPKIKNDKTKPYSPEEEAEIVERLRNLGYL